MTNSKYATWRGKTFGLATAVLATLVAGSLTTSAAQADAGGNGNGNAYGNWTDNPNNPAYDHPWRHGALPTLETKKAMDDWDKEFYHHGVAFASTQPSPSAGQLKFGGGVSGVGVLSGQAKVYLVFYGTQWGTQGSDANGNLTFTGDSFGAAAAVQNMFKGIGTNNELWSADLTQWCDGPNVASGATTCPSNAAFVPYQQNIFAGVWYDNTKASPAAATAAQLGQEAVSAAAHFGNTTAASNRYTYYVILSPHGTNPDNYQSPTQGYCAWHDYTADVGVSSPYGQLAFSNQPYNMDVGASCGVGFVNGSTNGKLDGYTMTLGHEWHETMSDQYPAGGWTNKTGGTYNGQENSDECAWIAAGQAGGAANIAFSTGTFAEQASWSNDTGACAISHPIVNHTGGGTPTANFSFVTSGLTATFTDTSTDSGGTIGSHSWTFGDSGTSTATNPSHTYAAAGSYTVQETVTDSASGASNSKSSIVTVSSGGGGGSSQLLANTGFESTASWTATAGVLCPTGCSGESAHAGAGFAWLDGYTGTHTDTLSQQVVVTAGKTTATLQYYLHIDTAETTTTTAYDKLTVGVYNTSGTLLKTLSTYSNLNKNTGYTVHTNDLSAYIGQTVVIKFTGTEDSSLQTSFVLDDVTLTVQ